MAGEPCPTEHYGSVMRDPVAPAPLLAKLAVAIDVGVRCLAIAVVCALIRDMWDEVAADEPNTDGMAGPIFVASMAYVLWSVVVLATSAYRWRNRSIGDATLLVLIGALSAVRYVLIGAVADDRTWFSSGSWLLEPDVLRALAIGSGTCAVVAGIAVIQIVRSSGDRVDAGRVKRRAAPTSQRR